MASKEGLLIVQVKFSGLGKKLDHLIELVSHRSNDPDSNDCD